MAFSFSTFLPSQFKFEDETAFPPLIVEIFQNLNPSSTPFVNPTTTLPILSKEDMKVFRF